MPGSGFGRASENCDRVELGVAELALVIGATASGREQGLLHKTRTMPLRTSADVASPVPCQLDSTGSPSAYQSVSLSVSSFFRGLVGGSCRPSHIPQALEGREPLPPAAGVVSEVRAAWVVVRWAGLRIERLESCQSPGLAHLPPVVGPRDGTSVDGHVPVKRIPPAVGLVSPELSALPFAEPLGGIGGTTR
jgi:hypothetical protein